MLESTVVVLAVVLLGNTTGVVKSTMPCPQKLPIAMA